MESIWQCERPRSQMVLLSVFWLTKTECSGALEPKFFQELLRGLSLSPNELPGPREDRNTWPLLADLFAVKFRSKPRAEWTKIFDYRDACCTPVLTQDELEEVGYCQHPMVELKSSPALPVS